MFKIGGLSVSESQSRAIEKQGSNQLFVRVLLAILSCCLYCEFGYGEIKNTKGGMLDYNLYPYLNDVDNDSVVTINIAATLEHGISYFSLTNFYNQDNVSELKESTSFYTEQNIRWRIPDSSIDITTQLNFRSGEDNDRHRLGVRWRLNDSPWLQPAFSTLHLSWSINIHAFQFDHTDKHEWQMEHVFHLTAPYLSSRLYLAGFIDQTFGEDLPSNYPTAPIVAEAQVGFRILENMYLVTEYRINDYRRDNVSNLAIGIEYKLLW